MQEETERILKVISSVRPARQNYQMMPSVELSAVVDANLDRALKGPLARSASAPEALQTIGGRSGH